MTKIPVPYLALLNKIIPGPKNEAGTKLFVLYLF